MPTAQWPNQVCDSKASGKLRSLMTGNSSLQKMHLQVARSLNVSISENCFLATSLYCPGSPLVAWVSEVGMPQNCVGTRTDGLGADNGAGERRLNAVSMRRQSFKAVLLQVLLVGWSHMTIGWRHPAVGSWPWMERISGNMLRNMDR